MANVASCREMTSDGTLPAYAWPGGYPMYYLCADGSIVCPACANEDSEPPVIEGDAYWEGPALDCEDGSSADCSKIIESAYGDPDA